MRKAKKPMDLDSKKIKVSGDGVFFSLQGEGSTMGIPSVFLRLHFCNLKCTWCDTRYTWDTELNEFWNEMQQWTIEECISNINKSWQCKNRIIRKRLVITGGEPLLQQDNIALLIEKLPEWDFEIETNGTIKPIKLLRKRCQFNCSPKLNNSLNPEELRINRKAIEVLKNLNTYFKFVVDSIEDIRELEKSYINEFEINPNKVIIMPKGITQKSLTETAIKIVDVVKAKGYRLLLRMHVEIWGDLRGV